MAGLNAADLVTAVTVNAPGRDGIDVANCGHSDGSTVNARTAFFITGGTVRR